jgi:hypothetical protein
VTRWNSSRRAKRLQWLRDAETIRLAQEARPQTGRYAIEFRGGSYFVNADHLSGGPPDQALRFEHKRTAECYMRAFPWLFANGGMVVNLGGAA